MLPAARGPLLPTACCYPCWCELTVVCHGLPYFWHQTQKLESRMLVISTPDPLGMSILSFHCLNSLVLNRVLFYTAQPKANTLPPVRLYVPMALVDRSTIVVPLILPGIHNTVISLPVQYAVSLSMGATSQPVSFVLLLHSTRSFVRALHLSRMEPPTAVL